MTMEAVIRQKLISSLNPSQIEVINESHLHHGHAGDDGSGESHFRVRVVSTAFAGLSRIEAQRKVYDILQNEIKQGLHALSINVLAE